MDIHIDDIKSNRKRTCARCGVLINEASDSGWEAFVDATTIQPICVWCDAEEDKIIGYKIISDTEATAIYEDETKL